MKYLRRRIKGIKNTGKITRAMEMISAVKMRKAVNSVVSIRPYAQSALQVLNAVAGALEGKTHPLLVDRSPKEKSEGGERVLVVVITSNRGLCGSYNVNLMRQVKSFHAGLAENATVDFLSIGKKGDQMLSRMKSGKLVASFPALSATPTMEGLFPVMRLIIDEYQAGNYDRCAVIYTNYISGMTQKSQVRQLLPVSTAELAEELKEMLDTEQENEKESAFTIKADFIIEPDPAQVLDILVPRLLEIQLFHALLESQASEEAARMMAMRMATDATNEMAYELTLVYNQLRQTMVTQEIAELSAGMAALGHS